MRLLSMRLVRNAVARYSRGAAALAVAGGYAAVVVGVAVFVIVATSLQSPSFAGVWLLLVTLPSSLVVHFIPAQGMAFVLLLTLGGLVQAWLLWVLLRGKRLPVSAVQ